MHKHRFTLIILLLGISFKTWAWGQTGHRVVAKIAEEHISPITKSAIKELLGNETMVMASTWMDEIRSDDNYAHLSDWHWVTIPDGMAYAHSKKNINGDVIAAIELCKQILRSDTGTDTKSKYLRFLIHLVADLHQPLHIGNGQDAGGNRIKINWFYDHSNLHSIWDSKMINSKNWSYSELVENLNVQFLFSEDLQKGSIKEWAEESLQYRDQIYNIGSKSYLGYDYLYANWPLVENQLWKAGIRLAGVLDEVFCDC